MKSVMVAAMVVQLTASGGAGSSSLRTRQANEPKDVSQAWSDVGKHFNALKHEVDTLQHDYKETHTRLRHEAEQKKLESEGGHAPQTQRAPGH